MKPVLIVKTGCALPGVLARRGDFEAWIAAGMGAGVEIRVVRVFEGEALPDPESVAGAVVTGSMWMVSDREAWSERTAEWLADAVAVGPRGPAILGICYGHQLLAHGLAGVVGRNPKGREMGTNLVRFASGGAEEDARSSDPLLGSLDAQSWFQTSHLESVLQLPSGATRLASTALDPNHAFRVGERAWGIQFHPEFDDDIMRGYLAERAHVLRAEGLDPEALSRAVRPTPHGPQLLRRFAEIALDAAL